MLLDQLLRKLSVDGHRVLIFCQMVGMLNILSEYAFQNLCFCIGEHKRVVAGLFQFHHDVQERLLHTLRCTERWEQGYEAVSPEHHDGIEKGQQPPVYVPQCWPFSIPS
jgi:hypothetical protein